MTNPKPLKQGPLGRPEIMGFAWRIGGLRKCMVSGVEGFNGTYGI